MPRKLQILLTTEGTYPYHSGGVSTWCDNLIRGMEASAEFTLLPIMMNPYISVKYELPPNVVRVINVPLWGTEEPAEFILDIPFTHVYLAKQRTTRSVIRRHFIPLLRDLVRFVHEEPTDAQRGGEILYEMHRYFREFDYNATFKSAPAWEAFVEEVMSQVGAGGRDLPSLFELTEALRWLYRFLIPLNADPPRVDVTHSTAAAFCGLPCVIAKLRDGTPFLLTEHGVYIREQYLAVSRMQTSHASKDFLLSLIVAVARINYHFADQISPVCHYNKRWELAHGARESKIRVIHNGVDAELFAPRESQRSRATVVVSAARIDPLKDIETLIRAAAQVRLHQPDVQFLVYGAPSSQEYYRQCLELRSSLGLDHTVIFPGHSGSPWEVYNQGDIVALTSISEAFPYSVIEAMSCGRPVVASDVGGVREALAGCGLLVRPREVEAFADSIVNLLRDSDARFQMGQDARDRVLNTFTLDRFVQEYGASYRELAP